MKKIICAALASVLLFSITACGNNGQGDNTDSQSNCSQDSSASSDENSENAEQGSQTTQPGQENPEKEVTDMKMKIQIGDTAFTATLADNSSVDALKELLADGPLTLDMSDYANMEKGADLGITLPQNNEQMNTQAGDIILYQGRTFVIYYDTNSWSLTPIGKDRQC